MAGSYSVTDGVFSATPRPWSPTFSAEPPIAAYGPGFDIHPDGERFAVTPPPPVDGTVRGSQLVLQFNFHDELRRVAPLR